MTRWFPFLIAAAAIVAYANSFSAPFIMDDARVVTGSSSLHTLWPPWKAVNVPTRWIADLSFAVNFAVGGFTPADFRITNILIHALAGLFLYGIVRRTLRLPRLSGSFGGHADGLALVIAALWVVHPLQTNCVTYIAQRIEALMGLFFLATVYCFIRSATAAQPRRWSNAAIVCCALGMGTKEVMVTAPVVLLIYDGLLVSPSWTAALRARWKVHLALFLTVGIFALLFLMGIGKATGLNVTLLGRMVSPWRYLLTQTGVITHYLRLVFVPDALCINYRWPIAHGFGDVWPAATAIAALGIITAGGLLARRTFAFPLAWMFVILAPTSSILPIPDAAFEHRMYLPLAGALALTVLGLHAGWQRLGLRFPRLARAPVVLMLLAAVATACLITLTRARNADYLSDESLWKDVIAKRPGNYNGYFGLSGAWLAQGRNEEVIRLLEPLLTRMPDYSRMPYEEIARQWNADPSLPCIDYSIIHSILGFAYLNTCRTNESVRHLMEAMRVSPSRPTPYLNMGRIAFANGKLDEATMWLKHAYLRDPGNPDVLCTLASVHAVCKRWAAAMKLFRATLVANPTHGFARAQLAWMLATCPDAAVRNGPEAVAMAEPLVAMSGGSSARAHDILAAAYAESGQFDKAVFHANEALRMIGEKTSEVVQREENTPTQPIPGFSLAAVTARLRLYERQLPFRDTQ